VYETACHIKGNLSHNNQSVGVILPTFNGVKYLEEQINSILTQTFQHFTLHIFDDCSADQTINIVNKLSDKDPRIILHQNSSQLGVIKNINDALYEIDSDIYFLADQDDIWLPEKMEKQLAVMADENVIMTFTNLQLVDDNGQSMNTDFWSVEEIDPQYVNSPEIIAVRTMVTGCTMAFKKRLLEIALPIPEQATMHDHWLSFFAAKTGKIVPISEALVLYRQHSNNMIGASITPKQRRKRRYEGCVTYQDFKARKYQSYQELLQSNRLFEQRLQDHNMDHPPLKNYIVFYDKLINHKWIGAFGIALKIKKIPNANSFFRTVILTICFPVVFIFLRFIQNAGKPSEK
jgi:glycosyltransferase involved in cell wall biosynthesis